MRFINKKYLVPQYSDACKSATVLSGCRQIQRVLVLLIGFAFFITAPLSLYGQTMDLLKGPKGLSLKPYFHMLAGNLPSEKQSLSRLHVFVRIPYDNLQFVKKTASFLASCSTSLILEDDSGKVVARTNWRKQVETAIFSETNSSKEYLVSTGFIDAPPGDYILHVEVVDEDVGYPYRKTIKAYLKTFAGTEPVLSSIIPIRDFSGELSLEKLAERVVFDKIYSDTDLQPVLTIFAAGLPDSSNCYCKISDEDRETVASFPVSFSPNTAVPGRPDLQEATVSLSEKGLAAGKYLVSFEMETDRVEKKIHLITGSYSTVYGDLNTAVEQLRYIAGKKELEKMMAAPGKEKENLFLEFWKKRDLSPNDGTNEVMEEYYNRVDYSNTHFKELVEGWRTDRGLIHIKYGPPDEIESHPFELEYKAHEIWYYYRQSKTFYFYDRKGTGEYVLARSVN